MPFVSSTCPKVDRAREQTISNTTFLVPRRVPISVGLESVQTARSRKRSKFRSNDTPFASVYDDSGAHSGE